MRITTVSAALALALLCVGTSLSGQRADDQIDARSMALLQQGKDARVAGQIENATDAFETALVVDPRNRDAFIQLAEVSRTKGLNGKAIRLYREALLLEPNDLAALEGQGEAMVQKGAVARARENLAKIRTICAKACSPATQLSAVIAKGPPITQTAEARPAGEPATSTE